MSREIINPEQAMKKVEEIRDLMEILRYKTETAYCVAERMKLGCDDEKQETFEAYFDKLLRSFEDCFEEMPSFFKQAEDQFIIRWR